MKTTLQQCRAFTLLELIIVLVIVGVLALTVLPALRLADSNSVFEERNHLHWLVLQVQQRSMQDTAQLTTQCPTLVLNTQQAGQANQNVCASTASFNYSTNDARQLQIRADHQLQGLVLPALLRFDSWGRPQGSCAAGCTMQITDGTDVASVCIAATGLVEAC